MTSALLTEMWKAEFTILRGKALNLPKPLTEVCSYTQTLLFKYYTMKLLPYPLKLFSQDPE